MSRTYRDGGTSGHYEKFARKYSTRSERMNEREFITRAKIDADAPLNYSVEPRDPTWGNCWNGWWRPMNRWLNSHVGESWNQVYSILIAKLKTVTSTDDERALRKYITNCVSVTPDPRYPEGYSYFRWDFFVDDEGLLQKKQRKYVKRDRIPKYDTSSIAEWLNGRIIGKSGNKLFWFEPVSKSKKYGRRGYSEEWKCEWIGKYYYDRGGLEYLYHDYETVYDKDGKPIGRKSVWKRTLGYKRLTAKQSSELSREEMEDWNKLPKWYQDKILEWSPTNSEPPKRTAGYYYW